jgi:hypothetical protein
MRLIRIQILIVLIVVSLGCERDASIPGERTEVISPENTSKEEPTPESTQPEPAATRSPLAPSEPASAQNETDRSPAEPDNAAPQKTDTPPEDAGDEPEQALDCQEETAQIKQSIEQLDRSCRSDDDCKSHLFGCPFGCGTIYTDEAEVDVIQKRIGAYEAACRRCRYSCMPLGPPKCVDGTCKRIEPERTKSEGETIDLW